ncbi:MAG: hypothetical protein IJ374_09730 [Lachnospiraceae bacterium]|nr:hypothetical protein [Lachnospiraceae bacterium]
MQVDILIDRLTECLVERSTGRTVETKYIKRENPIKKREYSGWKFDWDITMKNGYSIYELFVEGNDIVQGRISLKIEGGVVNIDIVETAPHNFGHEGKYEGVGGHLFAIACKISFDAGCDGVVAFDAKSSLVEYYKKELGAIEIYPRRLVIFEDAAQKLLDQYIRK